LATSTARVSQLQLEASTHQQKAAKLQCELSSALQDSESHCKHIASLEVQLEELKEAAERSQTQYRSEKQRRKEMELRLTAMEEELQDLKSDKENLERVCRDHATLSERKKKWLAERQHRDEEVEELRKSSLQELDNLRAQLRKARTCNDSAASEQVKRVMNGVFHSLRAEFELSESYSGQAVLGVIVTTIKNVTLQLLSGTKTRSPLKPENREEENEDDESEDVKKLEQKCHVHVNGEREVKEKKIVEEEHVAHADYHQVNEAQMVQDVKPEAVTKSEAPSQAEDSEASDVHPVSSAEPASQDPETEPVESVVQQEQEQPCASDTCTTENDLNKCLPPVCRPDESSVPEDAEEESAAENSGVDLKTETQSVEDTDHADHIREITASASLKAFGPPANPPPPPTVEQSSSAEDTR
ncbi:hypothetical protein GOODEAATRI_013720, partial [Goodea atripinnis]